MIPPGWWGGGAATLLFWVAVVSTPHAAMGGKHSNDLRQDDWLENDGEAPSPTRGLLPPGMTAMPRPPFAQWRNTTRVPRPDSKRKPLPSRPPPTNRMYMNSPTEEHRPAKRKQLSKQRRRQKRFAKQKEFLENRAKLDRVNQELVKSVLNEERRRQLQDRANQYLKKEERLLGELKASPDHQPQEHGAQRFFSSRPIHRIPAIINNHNNNLRNSFIM